MSGLRGVVTAADRVRGIVTVRPDGLPGTAMVDANYYTDGTNDLGPAPFTRVMIEPVAAGRWAVSERLGAAVVLVHDDFAHTAGVVAAAGRVYGDTPWWGVCGTGSQISETSVLDAMGCLRMRAHQAAVVRMRKAISGTVEGVLPAEGALWLAMRVQFQQLNETLQNFIGGLLNSAGTGLTAISAGPTGWYTTASFGSTLTMVEGTTVEAGKWYTAELMLTADALVAGWVNGSGPAIDRIPGVGYTPPSDIGVYFNTSGRDLVPNEMWVDWFHLERIVSGVVTTQEALAA